MKKLKIVLALFVGLHMLFSIRFNLLGLTALKLNNEENKINWLGKLFVGKKGGNLEKALTISPFEMSNFYNVYTGTNRGYTFFSPNISPVKAKLCFFDGEDQLEIPLKNTESKSKLSVTTYYLLVHLDDEKIRNQILRPIASRLFALHPEALKLESYIDFIRIPSIKEDTERGAVSTRLKAFTITRPIDEQRIEQ